MAHSDDINAQKKAAHDTAQAKLDRAIELKNAGQPRMNKAIADLLDARDALNLADLRADAGGGEGASASSFRRLPSGL
jgi:hypothetical protein